MPTTPIHFDPKQRLFDSGMRAEVFWHAWRWCSPPHLYRNRQMPFAVLVTVHDGDYRWRADGGDWVVVAAGETMVIPSNCSHCIEALTDVLVTVWHIDYRLFYGLDPLSLCCLPPVLPSSCEAEMDTLASQFPKPGAGFLVDELARRQAVAYGIFRLVTAQSRPRDGWQRQLAEVDRLEPVLRTIERSVARRFTRDELATRCGLSPSQFHKIFRDALGCSPMEYVRQRRMSHALALLLTGDHPVKAVAHACGYDDPLFFSRSFKAYYGFAPTCARERLAGPGGDGEG